MKHFITSIAIVMILKSFCTFLAQESENKSIHTDPPPKDKDQWKTNRITKNFQKDPPPKNGGQW